VCCETQDLYKEPSEFLSTMRNIQFSASFRIWDREDQTGVDETLGNM
jgi:hypothetical protein